MINLFERCHRFGNVVGLKLDHNVIRQQLEYTVKNSACCRKSYACFGYEGKPGQERNWAIFEDKL